MESEKPGSERESEDGPDSFGCGSLRRWKHARHQRKGAAAEPYLNHLIEVAQLVSNALSEPDANLIAAALLHDTLEDADATNEELIARFGYDVADLLAEVTRARILKLADKISNMRAILFSPPSNWDFQQKKEYFTSAKRVVDGFNEPNPGLLAEFQKTFREFDDVMDA